LGRSWKVCQLVLKLGGAVEVRSSPAILGVVPCPAQIASLRDQFGIASADDIDVLPRSLGPSDVRHDLVEVAGLGQIRAARHMPADGLFQLPRIGVGHVLGKQGNPRSVSFKVRFDRWLVA
jgi:hypothetical protein